MPLDYVNSLPAWARQALFSLIALLAAYALGRFLSHTVCGRLSAWVAKTAWKWDEVVVESLRAKEFVDQYLVKHQFLKKLHVRYQQEGIKIPFPTRTVLTESPD